MKLYVGCIALHASNQVYSAGSGRVGVFPHTGWAS